MAKAKTKKPELATVHHVDLGLNAVNASLALQRRAFQENASGVSKRLFDLEEAICPRVAARLTALEKSRALQIQENDANCTAHARTGYRVAALERATTAKPAPRPNTWHPNGLDRLAADLRADQARAGRMTSDELHIKTILAYARKLSPAGLTQLYTQLVNQEEGI